MKWRFVRTAGVTGLLVLTHCLAVANSAEQPRVRIANYLHEKGVIVRGFNLEIPETAAVNDEDFADVADLGRIDRLASYSKALTSEALADLLSRLEGLRFVTLEGPGVDDEVIAALGQHASSLEHVALSGPFRGHHLDALRGIGTTQPIVSLVLRCEPVPPEGAKIGTSFGLTAEAVSNIGKLRGLRTLSVRGCGITDYGLAHFKTLGDLVALELDGNPITGTGLAEFEALTRLERLTLAACRLTDEAMVEFPHLPSLQLLRISNNQIGNQAMVALVRADLDELSYLNVGRTDITDDGLRSIASLRNIQELILASTRVEGLGLAQLRGLSLRMLDLSSTRFSDAYVDKLQDLGDLQVLVASDTLLTDEAVPELGSLKNLRLLYLTKTRISNAALQSLSESLPDCRIETSSESRAVPRLQLIPGGMIPTD